MFFIRTNGIPWIRHRAGLSRFLCTIRKKDFTHSPYGKGNPIKGYGIPRTSVIQNNFRQRGHACHITSITSATSISVRSVHPSLPSEKRKRRWWEVLASPPPPFLNAWFSNNILSDGKKPINNKEEVDDDNSAGIKEVKGNKGAHLDDARCTGDPMRSIPEAARPFHKKDLSSPSPRARQKQERREETRMTKGKALNPTPLQEVVGSLLHLKEGEGGARRALSNDALPQLRWIRSIALQRDETQHRPRPPLPARSSPIHSARADEGVRVKSQGTTPSVSSSFSFSGVETVDRNVEGMERYESETEKGIHHYVRLLREAAYARQKEGPFAHDEAARHWLLLEMVETKIEHAIRRSMRHATDVPSYPSFAMTSSSPLSESVQDLFSPIELKERIAQSSMGKQTRMYPSRPQRMEERTEEKPTVGKKEIGTSVNVRETKDRAPSSALLSCIDEIILTDADLASAHSLDLIPLVMMNSYVTHCYNAEGRAFPFHAFISFPSPLSLTASSFYPLFSFSTLFRSMKKGKRRNEKEKLTPSSLQWSASSSPSSTWPAASLVRAAIIGMAVSDNPSGFSSVCSQDPQCSSWCLLSNAINIAMLWCLCFLEYRDLPSPLAALSPSVATISTPFLKGCWVLPFSFKSIIVTITRRPFVFTPSFFNPPLRLLRISSTTASPAIPALYSYVVPAHHRLERHGEGEDIRTTPVTMVGKDTGLSSDEKQKGRVPPRMRAGIGREAMSFVVATEGIRDAWRLAKAIPTALLHENIVFLADLEVLVQSHTHPVLPPHHVREENGEAKKDGSGVSSSFSFFSHSSPSSRIHPDDPPACCLLLPGVLAAAHHYYSAQRRRERHRKNLSPPSSPHAVFSSNGKSSTSIAIDSMPIALPHHQHGEVGDLLSECKNWMEAHCLQWEKHKEKERRKNERRGNGHGKQWDHPPCVEQQWHKNEIHTSSCSSCVHCRVPLMVWETYWSILPPSSCVSTSTSSFPSVVDRGALSMPLSSSLSSTDIPAVVNQDSGSPSLRSTQERRTGEGSERHAHQGEKVTCRHSSNPTSRVGNVYPVTIPLGRLMGLCRQTGDVEKVLRLFLQLIARRLEEYEHTARRHSLSRPSSMPSPPSHSSSSHQSYLQKGSMEENPTLAIIDEGCRIPDETNTRLLTFASEIPSRVLCGLHPAAFNHALAALAIQKQWAIALTWYRRLLSLYDTEEAQCTKAAAVVTQQGTTGHKEVPSGKPSSSSRVLSPPVNFFTHFVIVQMFLSPSVLLPSNRQNGSPSSTVSSGVSVLAPPLSFYNSESFEVCGMALRYAKGESPSLHGSSSSVGSLPPSAVLWSRGGKGGGGREGIGELLEERFALWEWTRKRSSDSLPASFASAARFTSFTTKGMEEAERKRKARFLSSSMRRCLIQLLSLLLFPSHPASWRCTVKRTSSGSPPHQASSSAHTSRNSRSGEQHKDAAIPTDHMAQANWRDIVVGVLKHLIDRWRCGTAPPYPCEAPTPEESTMEEVVCLALAMLMSVPSTRFSIHSDPTPTFAKGGNSNACTTRSKAEEEVKKNIKGSPGFVRATAPRQMEVNPFLSDPLYDILQKSEMLSHLRRWICGSQPRLNHIIHLMLHCFVDIHHEQQTAPQRREDPGYGYCPRQALHDERKENKKNDLLVMDKGKHQQARTLYEASVDPLYPPPFLVRFFASSLEDHHRGFLKCITQFMGCMDSALPDSVLNETELGSHMATRSSLRNQMDDSKISSLPCDENKNPLHYERGESVSSTSGGVLAKNNKKRAFSHPSLCAWQRWASILTLLTDVVDEDASRCQKNPRDKNEARTPSEKNGEVQLDIAHGASIVVASGSDAMAALYFLRSSLPPL